MFFVSPYPHRWSIYNTPNLLNKANFMNLGSGLVSVVSLITLIITVRYFREILWIIGILYTSLTPVLSTSFNEF